MLYINLSSFLSLHIFTRSPSVYEFKTSEIFSPILVQISLVTQVFTLSHEDGLSMQSIRLRSPSRISTISFSLIFEGGLLKIYPLCAPLNVLIKPFPFRGIII